MEFRFGIEDANSLAHILELAGATPESQERTGLWLGSREFSSTFAKNFNSSLARQRDLRQLLAECAYDVGTVLNGTPVILRSRRDRAAQECHRVSP